MTCSLFCSEPFYKTCNFGDLPCIEFLFPGWHPAAPIADDPDQFIVRQYAFPEILCAKFTFGPVFAMAGRTIFIIKLLPCCGLLFAEPANSSGKEYNANAADDASMFHNFYYETSGQPREKIE
jgi:hypothetical protein